MFFNSKKSSASSAFTLVEYLVTMGIAGLVFTAISALVLHTGRSFAMMGNYTDLDNKSRTALDIMTRDIRQVNFLRTNTNHELHFYDYDDKTLSFVYNPEAKVLTRIKEGESNKVLLIECDFLQFRIWRRINVPGSYDLEPTTESVRCKAVDVSWVCSRKMFGERFHTESVQTARIVLRKQHDPKPF